MPWNEGYVIDVDYTRGFYQELAPRALAFTALALGVEPPEVNRPYTYFEIGCGHGFTSNLLAAANPQGSFFANDFNPTHIRNARALAADAGLTNVTFLENSFEELEKADLPQFDFITLHGVYSWVSEGARRAIVDFIRRKLNPGGLVYISYNSMPGWASMGPVQRLLSEYAAMVPGPTDRKFRQAVEFAQKLNDKGARFFAANPSAAARLEDLKKRPVKYLLHEYMNAHWYIPYHADVVREMSEAKLTFVGSWELFQQFDEFCVTEDLRTVLEEVADPVRRETFRDLAVNKQFRKDVFVRGATHLTPQDHQDRLREMCFALVDPVRAAGLEVSVPLGKLSLDAKIYNPLLQELTKGPRRVADLLSVPEIAAIQPSHLQQALVILVAAGYVKPACHENDLDRARSSAKRFNRPLLDRTVRGEGMNFLASPVIGSGIPLSGIEGMFLVAMREGEDDPAKAVWTWLSRQGRRLVKDGKQPETDEESLENTRVFAEEFVHSKLPTLRHLGVEPATSVDTDGS